MNLADLIQASRRLSRILLVAALAAALGGCEPVQSLHPFFDSKDAVFDSALDGTWVSTPGQTERANLTKMRFQEEAANPPSYEVEATFPNDQPKTNRDEPEEITVTFSVHVFLVGDLHFADFYPLKYSAKWGSRIHEFDVEHALFWVPTHTVYRVKVEGNQLLLAWLDDVKVKDFIEQNNLPLPIDEDHTGDPVLTSETEQLKARLLLQAEKEDLLATDLELIREE